MIDALLRLVPRYATVFIRIVRSSSPIMSHQKFLSSYPCSDKTSVPFDRQGRPRSAGQSGEKRLRILIKPGSREILASLTDVLDFRPVHYRYGFSGVVKDGGILEVRQVARQGPTEIGTFKCSRTKYYSSTRRKRTYRRL